MGQIKKILWIGEKKINLKAMVQKIEVDAQKLSLKKSFY